MKKAFKKLIRKVAPSVADSLSGTRRLHAIEARLETMHGEVRRIHDEVSFRDNRLVQLQALAAEVEPYQPAYGIVGAIDCPRRSSQNRCIAIEAALRPLAGKRILDIGSSLGYFSFYLSDRGAYVEGWDLSPKNIEVSRLISALNGVDVVFKTKELTNATVSTIVPGQYDVALVLSVFHHIIHHKGLAYTQELVRELFERVPTLIVELARKGEDKKLFWDEAQPEDELAIFATVEGEIEIKRLGVFGNHLSKKNRPLYMVTKKNSTKVGVRDYTYDYSTTAAYQDSPVASSKLAHRRYYFAPEYIIKEYGFERQGSPANLRQIVSEVHAFVNVLGPGEIYHAPEMLDFSINDFGAKIVVKRIPGKLLSDLDRPLPAGRMEKIAKDILTTLADLEAQKFHHNDVRSWNILYNRQGAWLIDYGYAGPIASEDDIVALLWALSAVIKQEREPYERKKSLLPPKASFKSPYLAHLYAQVQQGERSPGKLLRG